jgi:hypothetical protein
MKIKNKLDLKMLIVKDLVTENENEKKFLKIYTSHDTFIVYDYKTNKLVHTSMENFNRDFHRFIVFKILNNSITLYLKIGNALFQFGIDRNRNMAINYGNGENLDSDFILSTLKNSNELSIINNDLFMSADINGDLKISSPHLSAWETFNLNF